MRKPGCGGGSGSARGVDRLRGPGRVLDAQTLADQPGVEADTHEAFAAAGQLPPSGTDPLSQGDDAA